jgi:antirestriction protein ArdC
MDTESIATTPDRDAVFREITESIIEAIEAGAANGGYRMPWNQTPLSHRSVEGRGYRGLNVLLLSIAALRRGFGSPVWGTVKAWNAKGGTVRKGERGTRVVLWKATQKTPPWEDQEGDAADNRKPACARLYARAFTLFNLCQVEGVDPEVYDVGPRPLADLIAPDWRVFEAATSIGARVEFGGVHACYMPAFDLIKMPDRWRFSCQREITSTLAHEAIHATGHRDRLARDFSGRFGERSYAVEELVAELGAAMLLGVWGYQPTERADHAQYIASWLKVLREEPRAIMTVASKAQAAADFLLAAATVRDGQASPVPKAAQAGEAVE